MDEFTYYLSFLFTIIVCFIAILRLKKLISSGSITIASAKTIYTYISGIWGIFGSVMFFLSTKYFLSVTGIHINLGHGEVLVSLWLYNFLLSLFLIGFGRAILESNFNI